MKGRKPTEEEKDWMDDICQFGCIVCYLEFDGLYTPAVPHHIEGKTKPGAHFQTIPLCPAHHQTGPYGVAFHQTGKKVWEAEHGSQIALRERIEQLIFERQGVIF